MLGNGDCCAPFIESSDDGIAVECLVGDKSIEYEGVNQRWDFHTIEALSGRQTETNEIAQSIRQRENFRRHNAIRATYYALTLHRPFALWP